MHQQITDHFSPPVAAKGLELDFLTDITKTTGKEKGGKTFP